MTNKREEGMSGGVVRGVFLRKSNTMAICLWHWLSRPEQRCMGRYRSYILLGRDLEVLSRWKRYLQRFSLK